MRDAPPVAAVLGDVRDARLLAQMFSLHTPDIVFHAAAIKHVPMAEDNPEEAILTNVIGSKLVAEACVAHTVGTMVLISTDKAVNPASIMGASKKLAEMVCQAPASPSAGTTKIITVRFGNVLGSTGSVVPLFQEQIARGGPLTVTHVEMTRYFMTIREAVELVLQAAAIGAGMHNVRAPIFVLDMGKPVRILDIAMQMIRLAGLKPYEDIAITITGLRPGEKLHEELFHAGETLEKTQNASIFLASSRGSDYSQLNLMLETLHSACRERNRGHVLRLLKQLVPEFQPLKHSA